MEVLFQPSALSRHHKGVYFYTGKRFTVERIIKSGLYWIKSIDDDKMIRVAKRELRKLDGSMLDRQPTLKPFEAHPFLLTEECCLAYLKEFENESADLKQIAEDSVRIARQRIE